MSKEKEKHKPCPWCGIPGIDFSAVTEPEELKKYKVKNLYPVGCCNPDCAVQPESDNESWDLRYDESSIRATNNDGGSTMTHATTKKNI